MSKRLNVSRLMIIVMGLVSLPVSQAQVYTQGADIRISAYRDDPFVNEARVERMDASMFNVGRDQQITLINSRALVQDESIIYREDKTTHQYKPFAWNPWPEAAPNKQGNFKFQDEARFPLFEIERG